MTLGIYFNGIWGSSSSDIFAVAASGIIMHYNGSSWSAMYTGTDDIQFNGVWGTSPNNVYTTGSVYEADPSGAIYHYNGSSWSEVFRPSEMVFFTSIWGSSANDVYAVGIYGKIYHFNGSSWSKKQMPDIGKNDVLVNVWGSSAKDVFIAAQSGIYHYGGGSDNPDDSDNDGDGYTTAQGDCNDNDAAIHPGATEICGDGIDNNCNGTVDEGCVTTQTWYKDADSDDYSDGATLQSVNRPALTYYLTSELTAISGDCNDNDAAIHPGANEICGDGKDNNCNGTVDEGCSQTNPPIANAGTDKTVSSGDSVTLDGSGSTDSDGTIASFL